MDKFQDIIASSVASLKGVLVCQNCKNFEVIGDANKAKAYLISGHPVCCGKEMEWLLPGKLKDKYPEVYKSIESQ